MADVSVKFGASLTELLEGVRGAKDAIESIKESTDRVTEGFKTLVEIAGVSLSIEGFKSFVDTMAELGSKTETSMAQLGQSASQITQLQGIARVSGTSFEALQASIEKGSLTVQKSTKDAYNPAAQALRVLGLTAKDLVGLPADQWFARVSEAVSKFNPSLNLTNAVTAAFGRGASQMLPLLLEGSERFKEMQAAVRGAQEGLAAAIPGMAETHERISILGLSLQSFGARIFSVLKPAIDSAIASFTKWIQSLDSEKINGAVKAIVDAVAAATLAIGNFFIGLEESYLSVSNEIDVVVEKIQIIASAAGKLASFGASINPMFAPIRGAIAAVNALADVFGKIPTAAQKAGEDTAKRLQNQRDQLQSYVTQFRSMFATLAVGGAPGAAPETGKQNAGAIDAGAKNELTAQATRIEEQIAAEQAKLARIKEILNQEAETFKITENQKAVFTETAIQQAFEAEMALIAKKEKLYEGDIAKYAEVEKEKAKLTQAYQQDMIKTVEASQKAMAATIEHGLSTITSAFNSQLKGLITGTTSWAQATKNIAGDLFMKLIELGEQWVVKHASQLIADAATSKTTAAASVVSSAAADAAAATGKVTIDAGVAYAGVFANLAPLLGPAAAGPASAAYAQVLAVGLPKLDVGAWEIPGTMPAMLHAGEMVMPAAFAQSFRSAVGAGGGGGSGSSVALNINASQINTTGMRAMLVQLAPQLARLMQQQQQLNPSLSY